MPRYGGRRQELVNVRRHCDVIRTRRVLKCADVCERQIHAVCGDAALVQQGASLFQTNRGYIPSRDRQPSPGEKYRVSAFPAAEVERGGLVWVSTECPEESQSSLSDLTRLRAEEVTVGSGINAIPIFGQRKCHGGLFAVPGTIPCVDLETGLFLLAPAGRILLAEAGKLRVGRAEMLTALTRLRKSASPELANAAWEQSDLEKRGETKFGPLAAQMYFVREALEQASGRGTADYHASRLKAAGAESISDLGGGIGGDALAFARAGLRVTLYESDPVRAMFAAENARVWEMDTRIAVRQEDFTKADLDTDAAWLDPARRQNSRRVAGPEDYTPPLSWLHTLKQSPAKAVGVKLSPAIDHALAAQFEAELEFISESGECREALLWLGAAKSGHLLSATVITPTSIHTLFGEADERGDWTAPTGSRYLYEPDPAVIRAHLVGTLAVRLRAATVDPQIAYLLGDTLAPTPFADAYEILDQFPYSKKRLQDALTARNIGRVIIKKRGFPTEPDELGKMLKLRGSEEAIVILARVSTGHAVFLCRLADKAI